MYSYILFDLDGTLSDPKPGITKSVQYALRFFGIEEPDLDRLEAFIGPPLTDSFREFYGFDDARARRAVEKYRERFSVTGLYENTLYPGMEQMLRRLCEAGAHLAVASSKPEVFVKKILRYFGIESCFEVVVGSNLDGSRVKKEEVVAEALARLFAPDPVKPELAAMVGDRRYDVEGARAVGAHPVAVSYGYAQPGEWEACGIGQIAATVQELEEILMHSGG